MAQGAVHEKLWTPANVVTLLRICLVPVFAPDGGAQSIATIPLNTYPPEAAATVVLLLLRQSSTTTFWLLASSMARDTCDLMT